MYNLLFNSGILTFYFSRIIKYNTQQKLNVIEYQFINVWLITNYKFTKFELLNYIKIKILPTIECNSYKITISYLKILKCIGRTSIMYYYYLRNITRRKF